MLHLKTFRTRSIAWELFRVNFRPLQEIEAIIGGGRIFDTGPFFARLGYMYICHTLVGVGSWLMCTGIVHTYIHAYCAVGDFT